MIFAFKPPFFKGVFSSQPPFRVPEATRESPTSWDDHFYETRSSLMITPIVKAPTTNRYFSIIIDDIFWVN
jgi:hypothetical protein